MTAVPPMFPNCIAKAELRKISELKCFMHKGMLRIEFKVLL